MFAPTSKIVGFEPLQHRRKGFRRPLLHAVVGQKIRQVTQQVDVKCHAPAADRHCEIAVVLQPSEPAHPSQSPQWMITVSQRVEEGIKRFHGVRSVPDVTDKPWRGKAPPLARATGLGSFFMESRRE